MLNFDCGNARALNGLPRPVCHWFTRFSHFMSMSMPGRRVGGPVSGTGGEQKHYMYNSACTNRLTLRQAEGVEMSQNANRASYTRLADFNTHKLSGSTTVASTSVQTGYQFRFGGQPVSSAYHLVSPREPMPQPRCRTHAGTRKGPIQNYNTSKDCKCVSRV